MEPLTRPAAVLRRLAPPAVLAAAMAVPPIAVAPTREVLTLALAAAALALAGVAGRLVPLRAPAAVLAVCAAAVALLQSAPGAGGAGVVEGALAAAYLAVADAPAARERTDAVLRATAAGGVAGLVLLAAGLPATPPAWTAALGVAAVVAAAAVATRPYR